VAAATVEATVEKEVAAKVAAVAMKVALEKGHPTPLRVKAVLGLPVMDFLAVAEVVQALGRRQFLFRVRQRVLALSPKAEGANLLFLQAKFSLEGR
jgi:hypothetical protein